MLIKYKKHKTVCIGVSISLLKITTSLFVAKHPLNQQIVQVATPLLGTPPSASILFFFSEHPPKSQIFQWIWKM